MPDPSPPTAPVDNRPFILILQHPQERREPLATAALVGATLRRSALAVGLSWPNLTAALGRRVDAKRWGVLYLGAARASAGGRDREVVAVSRTGQALADSDLVLHDLAGAVVLDGTWKEAKTLWWRNPWLLKLQRIVLNPRTPSRYGRLRREPRPEALSTLESVALLIEQVDPGTAAAPALRAAFDRLLADAAPEAPQPQNRPHGPRRRAKPRPAFSGG